MPGPGQSPWNIFKALIDEPVFKGTISGALLEGFTPTRSPAMVDESVGSFISRRVCRSVADNLVSALFHGIYAGDIWQLSAKSILPLPWAREAKHGNLAGAAFAAMLSKTSWNFCDDIELQMRLQKGSWNTQLRNAIKTASVFTFRRGIAQLTEALEGRIMGKRNIKVQKSTKVTAIHKIAMSKSLQVRIRIRSNSLPLLTSSRFYIRLLATRQTTQYLLPLRHTHMSSPQLRRQHY